jgi:hypothetical protein
MNALVRGVRRATSDDVRFRLHNWLCSHGATSRAYAAFQPKVRGNLVTHATQLVIEGFPRSANTYALAAFRCANGPDVEVADHLHAGRSVRVAAGRRVPCIVLVRDPVDACTSMIQRQPVRARTALDAYLRFYAQVTPVLGQVVVSDFATTTGDFGAVIDEVNRRFGTAYQRYEHTEPNEAWCRAFVTEADRVDQGAVRGSTIALPHADRAAGRERVRALVRAERELVGEARRMYDALRRAAVGG